jgi:hypothetical protein
MPKKPRKPVLNITFDDADTADAVYADQCTMSLKDAIINGKPEYVEKLLKSGKWELSCYPDTPFSQSNWCLKVDELQISRLRFLIKLLNGGGDCLGASLLWNYYDSQNRSDDFFSKLYELFKLCNPGAYVNTNDTAKQSSQQTTLKTTLAYIGANISCLFHSIHTVEESRGFMQNISYLQGDLTTGLLTQQWDTAEKIDKVCGNSPGTTTKYQVTGIFSLLELENVLRQTVQPGQKTILGFPMHAMAVSKKNGKYIFYDPNFKYGEVTFCSAGELARWINETYVNLTKNHSEYIPLQVQALVTKDKLIAKQAFSLANYQQLALTKNRATADGTTPLSFACQVGDYATAKSLVDAGAEFSEIKPEILFRALCTAISQHGGIKILQLALANGVSPNITYQNCTLLTASIMFGLEDITALLLKNHVDVNAQCEGTSPLQLAVQNGNKKIIRMLLNAGATADDKTLSLAEELAPSYKPLIGMSYC